MESPKVCRICLDTEAKMYQNSMLDSYYKEFINYDLLVERWPYVGVNIFSILPKSICYECSALLIKSREFQHKCMRGFELLLSCMKKGRIPHENVLLLDRTKHKLKSNLQYMGSNDKVRIILEKDGCDDDTSVKLEPTIKLLDQQSMALNSFKSNLCSSMAAINKLNSEHLNEPENIKIEMFENDLDDDLFDLNFEDVSQNPETIVAEPLALIQTDKVDIKKDKPKTVKKKRLKKTLSKERPIRLKHNKTRKLKMNENKSEKLETSQNCSTRDEEKKKRVRSADRDMKFDESKWKVLHFTDEEAEKKFEERREDSFYKTAPYKCDFCLKGFSNENILNAHMSLHNEDRGRLSCRFCKMRFSMLSKLNRHYDSHYNEYHCLQCPFIGRTATGAKFHEEMHDGTGYTCETCNENFMHRSTFYTHMRVIHRSSYVCGICGESYVTAKGLATHKARAHRIYAPRKTKRPKPTKIQDPEDSTYCTECKLTFETKEAYSIHLLSATNHAITQDGQMLSQLQEDKTEEKYVPFKLYRPKRHHPNYGMTKMAVNRQNKSDTLGLIIENTRGRNYRVRHNKATNCKLCGENFSSVKTCIAHYRQAHPRVPYYMQKRVVCDVCGASIQAGNLKIHMNKHTKKIQYPCSVCSRIFYIKETLKRHMLTHTGEKPWACALCDKTYQQVGSLRLHERTIHQRQKPPPRRRRANNVATNPFESLIQESNTV